MSEGKTTGLQRNIGPKKFVEREFVVARYYAGVGIRIRVQVADPDLGAGLFHQNVYKARIQNT